MGPASWGNGGGVQHPWSDPGAYPKPGRMVSLVRCCCWNLRFVKFKIFEAKDCWIQDCWIQGLLNLSLLNPRVVELEGCNSKDHWILWLLNLRLYNTRTDEFKIVDSKVCWIQDLLNPRIIESKVNIVEPKVVESKVAETIIHSAWCCSLVIWGQKKIIRLQMVWGGSVQFGLTENIRHYKQNG